ncbi:MAG: polyphenol oxidase family protein [Erysipelotrichaceae bacterium]|nr:polyphenol oxidase family protein [Erysipelotrichaceae bacterium]MDD3809543.1 polyphenol oxidase family protein [Erysipelotrichaceae bacterium]
MEKIEYFDLHPDVIVGTSTKALGSCHLENNRLANHENLALTLHVAFDDLVAPIQKHTSIFAVVDSSDRGTNVTGNFGHLDGVDALISQDDLVLLSFHADCTPVMIYCADKKIIASIHSGWKGTVSEITSKVTAYLIEKFQVDPLNVYAYIGPSLGKGHLEVQDDVIDLVRKMSFDTGDYYRAKDELHYLLDNKGLNKAQLQRFGVPSGNIKVSDFDTFDHNDIFSSHRRNRDGSRNVTFIKFK